MQLKTCVVEKYCNFNGRARRSEYWFYCLFNFLVGVVSGILVKATGIQLISTIITLALLLPGLGVSVRRLHDIGKAWPWILISFIPVVGWILIIVWACKDSDPGENAFGPCTK